VTVLAEHSPRGGELPRKASGAGFEVMLTPDPGPVVHGVPHRLGWVA
jgi:hypothetical protein